MEHLPFILASAFVAALVIYIVRRHSKRRGGTAARVRGYARERLDAVRKRIQER